MAKDKKQRNGKTLKKQKKRKGWCENRWTKQPSNEKNGVKMREKT